VITADCLSTLPKLSSEKNTSEARLNTKTSSAKITKGPACNAASVNRRPRPDRPVAECS
jgi:hypothetical protein